MNVGFGIEFSELGEIVPSEIWLKTGRFLCWKVDISQPDTTGNLLEI